MNIYYIYNIHVYVRSMRCVGIWFFVFDRVTAYVIITSTTIM